MADPIVVPALVGAAVAELLHQVLVAAGTAISCKKHCKSLKLLLAGLTPFVDEVIQRHQPGSSAAFDDWLQKLNENLEDAQKAVQECSSQRLLEPVSRYNMAKRILGVGKCIEDRYREAGMVNLTLTYSFAAEMGSYIKEMRDELSCINISSNARILFSETSTSSSSTENALHSIRNEVDNLAGATSTTMAATASLRTRGELQPVPDFVVGLDSLSCKLQQFLAQDDAGRWVGVWGRGGSGKTLLAQKGCNNREVRQCFGEQIFWITVAMHPSVVEIQRRLWKKITSREPDFENRQDGKRELYNLLQERKALIVLDDVWEEGSLEWLDVLSGSGSKMLITSRNLSVLERVNAVQLKVNTLSEEDSWKLFRVYAFLSEADVPPEIEDLSRQVAAECKGLPLALKVIGRTLAGKRSREEWQIVLKKLRDVRPVNQEVDEELFQRLKLSYDTLRAIDPRLQVCFLYFAAFPEDAEVGVDKLITYWKGEKMLGSRGDDEEDDAFCLIGMLVGRSLIERVPLKSACKIHDVLRDLALRICKSPVEQNNKICLFRAGDSLEEFPSEWMKRNADGNMPVEVAKRISLMNNQIASLPPRVSAENLHVLLLSQNRSLQKLNNDFLRGLTKLQVLDLSFTSIRSLPTSLGSLELLVSLDVSFSRIKELPSSIGQLARLERLNFRWCKHLFHFPSGISRLKSLNSLEVWGCKIWDGDRQEGWVRLWKQQAASLQSLRHLTCLTDLAIGPSQTVVNLPVCMSSLLELRSLSIFRFQELVRIPEEFRSFKNLRQLHLEGLFNLMALPSWIVDLPNLKQLRLFALKLTSLPALDTLPQLEILGINDCGKLSELPSSFTRQGAFPALKELSLVRCRGLKQLPGIEAGALPSLSRLIFSGCTAVTSLPPSLQELTTLTTLHLSPTTRDLSHIDFGCFKHLQELDLRGITVEELPSGLTGLPLKALTMDRPGPPIPPELESLVSYTMDDSLHYRRSVLSYWVDTTHVG